MESRYLKKGKLPGILFVVSSKKSEHDFIEKYVESQKGNPNMYVVDEPLWRVKGFIKGKQTNMYSGDCFKVGVGNKIVKSRILSDSDDESALLQQGYDRIIDVPIEHKQAFELDIDSAMMDIAGISCTSKSKFIAYDRLVKNYSQRRNPMKCEILTIGLDDNLEIKDFFSPLLVNPNDMTKPGFIHLDTSVTGDKTGFSYVVTNGTKVVDRYQKGGEVNEDLLDMTYKQVLSFAIQAPNDSEISFEKTRQFIYYLRSKGFNIRGVSADGYQSRDTIQQLTVAGYNARTLSLDRTPEGYITTRTCIYEERVDLLNIKNTLLESELINVEQDAVTGKVDHTVDGSKDIADSLVGAIFNASQYKRNLNEIHGANDGRVTSEMLQVTSSVSDSLVQSMFGVNPNQLSANGDFLGFSSDDGIIDF